MSVYLIIALEKFRMDWDIYKTVFSTKEAAEAMCKELNSKISGYEYFVKEKEFVWLFIKRLIKHWNSMKAGYIDWAWKWRKITEAEKDEVCDRICALFDGEI